MFKSIFTKYMLSFIALLAVGFISISAVITSVITSYSIKSNQTSMFNIAKVIYTNINTVMKSENTSFSDAVSSNRDTFSQIIHQLSLYSDSQFEVIVADENGKIILIAGPDESFFSETYSDEKYIDLEPQSDSGFKYSNLNGLFKTRRFNYYYPIYSSNETQNSRYIGKIIISTSAGNIQGISEQILKIILFASLWIFIAAGIAVYFITNRITKPIKIMNSAAKSYSKGDFTTRVPISGTDEIAELSQTFNQMADSLSVLESTRNTFLSSVSHDLRTPMTSIQGFIDGILDGTIPPEKHTYYLNIVSSEVKRLSRLVNSLLDISRMESGNFKLQKTVFDVCEVARLILISFEEKIDIKKINIEFETDDDPSEVFADKDAVHQILYNLIDNAIKFTYENGNLKIYIKSTADKYTISVYNTGLGIKKEELPFVFDRFFKSDSSRGLDKTGTGLGLYIAKSKLEAHGEKISVKSEYQKDCEFVFTLKKKSAESKNEITNNQNKNSQR